MVYFLNSFTDASSEERNQLENQMSAIDSFLYKSYKVLLLSKVRTKLEVNLGKIFIQIMEFFDFKTKSFATIFDNMLLILSTLTGIFFGGKLNNFFQNP